LAESVWIPCFVYEGNTNPVAAIASTTGGGPNAVTITKVPFGAFTVGWVGVSFQIAAQVTY
jgi:hypothetical protein